MMDDGPIVGQSAQAPMTLMAHRVPDGPLEPLAVPIGRLVSILRRHLWIIVLTCVFGIGSATMIVRRMPKLFSAEAAILVEPQRTQVSDLQAISPDPGDVGGLVRTQIDILRSQKLILGVVQAMHLADRPEFLPAGAGLVTSARDMLQRAGLLPPKVQEPLSPVTSNEIAAGTLAGKISFANEARSSVLRLTVSTQDPELSAAIANEITREYLDFKRRAKFAAMQRAHDWFQEQMGRLAVQLRTDEAAIELYRRSHGLDEQSVDLTGTPRTDTINRQQLDTISRQLIDVSRDRARKESQLAQAQAALHGGTQGSAVPEVLGAPVIVQLMGQVSAAAARESQLAASQGGGNPELAAARALLQRLQARLEQEVSHVVDSLSSDMRAARSQEDALRRQMSRLRSDVSDENSAQAGLQSLQSRARATRSIYESFLTRATQLANVSGIQEPDASLVSEARPPLGPTSPQTVRLIGVAAFLSLVAGVVLACVVDRLRGGFSRPEEIEQALGLPLLAMLPSVPASVIRGRRKGRKALALTVSLDKLRGQMRAFGEGQPKLIVVTSALPKEGKSVFASELARNAAAAGWKVLLMGCDLGSPSIARHYRLPAGPGLGEILAGRTVGPASAVVHEPEPRLHVIVAGTLYGDPQEQLASKRMSALMAVTRSSYDLVVLDTPPVLPVADALVLAGQADATILVVRWEKTGRVAVQDAMRLLRGSRARFLTTVLTRVDLRTARKSGGRLACAFDRYDGYHSARVNRS